jgi:hypothetical protein
MPALAWISSHGSKSALDPALPWSSHGAALWAVFYTEQQAGVDGAYRDGCWLAEPACRCLLYGAIAGHRMTANVQVFDRRQRWTLRARKRPAVEKRQGTKSRRRVVRGGCGKLWGFSRGVRV